MPGVIGIVCDLPMKFRSVIAILAALVATSFAMEQPSFHTKGTRTGPLRPGEYGGNRDFSPRGPVVVLVSLPQQTMHVYRNGHSRRPLKHQQRQQGQLHATRRIQYSRQEGNHYSKTYDNAF
jgi:hypothetical protein